MNTTSWIPLPDGSDFTLANFPFGIARLPDGRIGAASILGDTVIHLAPLAEDGLLSLQAKSTLSATVLNDFIALGKEVTHNVRLELMELFAAANSTAKDRISSLRCLYPVQEVELLLPVHIPDYTDFYSSLDHAMNVGRMFRGEDNALMPNWKHIPVGYHGRSSSIVVSGTPIRRPKGQTLADGAEAPTFGPSRLMDFELEMGFVVGKENPLGKPITCDQAEEHIFGLVLFNDWSARDIQKWEYVPLGPFLGKNFGSSMSPWIITLEALEPFRVQGQEQSPPVLPYLQSSGAAHFDVPLSVEIIANSKARKVVCESNLKHLYWSMRQQLAHHTVNGCNMRVGDLCASGTISGPEVGSFGSMLEISWKGSKPVSMPDGSERKFLLDGDTVVMRAGAGAGAERVGFGEVRSAILPSD